jgi:hypothetical protein
VWWVGVLVAIGVLLAVVHLTGLEASKRQQEGRGSPQATSKPSVNLDRLTCGEVLPKHPTSKSEAVLIVVLEKVGPEINDGRHSEKAARESVAGMLGVSCTTGFPATRPINEAFREDARALLEKVETSPPGR